jgi:hypothetical protein
VDNAPLVEIASKLNGVRATRTGLFCKSFAPDLPRLKLLVASILENNRSDLPIFVCVPRSELVLFKNNLPTSLTIIAEEEFTDPRCFTWLDGWRQQQVVKLSFHRLGTCDRYLLLDSDSYFIREFSEEDIFGRPSEIRIVASSNNYVFDSSDEIAKLAAGVSEIIPHSDLKIEFNEDKSIRIPRCFLHDENYKNCPPELASAVIPYAFGRKNLTHSIHFMPPPVIFSSEILKKFERCLADEEITFTDLIHLSPWEDDWYGHFAFKYFANLLTPVEPIFLWFITDEALIKARKMGISKHTLRKNFMGVTLAARHQFDLQL